MDYFKRVLRGSHLLALTWASRPMLIFCFMGCWDIGSCSFLSTGHGGHQHHRVAVCEFASLVRAVSVDEDNASGQLLLGNAAGSQLLQNFPDIGGLKLLFLDAGFDPQQAV